MAEVSLLPKRWQRIFQVMFSPLSLNAKRVETVTDSSCNLHFQSNVCKKKIHFGTCFNSILKQIDFGSWPFISYSNSKSRMHLGEKKKKKGGAFGGGGDERKVEPGP